MDPRIDLDWTSKFLDLRVWMLSLLEKTAPGLHQPSQ